MLAGIVGVPCMWRKLQIVLDWLNENSKALAIIGTLIGVLAAVYVFYFPPSPLSQTNTYVVCRGEKRGECGAADIFIGCGEIKDWARNACTKVTVGEAQARDGNACGYTHASVTCTTYLPSK
jgi:hypothetical protein